MNNNPLSPQEAKTRVPSFTIATVSLLTFCSCSIFIYHIFSEAKVLALD